MIACWSVFRILLAISGPLTLPILGSGLLFRLQTPATSYAACLTYKMKRTFLGEKYQEESINFAPRIPFHACF